MTLWVHCQILSFCYLLTLHLMLYHSVLCRTFETQADCLCMSIYPYAIYLHRTLLKQGMYGGKPPVKKVLIMTPGSLVKVSSLSYNRHTWKSL